jgi:futalosine hydrolase
MKVIIVAASRNEIKNLTGMLDFNMNFDNHISSYSLGGVDVDVLVTGHGAVFTTYHFLKALQLFNYDIAINAGIAGSYDYFLELGSVVNVVQDQFADIGIEESRSFFTLGEKEMMREDSFPFTGEILRNDETYSIPEAETMLRVKSVTLNTLNLEKERITRTKSKFNCDTETMEGAAFFYVCLMEKIPFLQIRAVSYFVELRKTENWHIPLAVKNLSDSVYRIIRALDR